MSNTDVPLGTIYQQTGTVRYTGDSERGYFVVLDVGGMQMLPKNGDIVDLHWTVGYKRHQCDRLKGNSEIIEYDPAGGAWHWSGRVCGRIAEGMEYCPRCGKKLE